MDSLTSNIGHLLGTGLLSDAESAQVAALLTTESMADGFGLRTMSTDDAGFSALSYHCGSIWAHDTAIVLAGLARDGHRAAALRLADGLLAAAEAFDYRLPRNCTAVTAGRRSDGRCPTRPPAARRPGPRRRPCCCSRPASASIPTCRTAGSTCPWPAPSWAR
ncbi:hypothetical protein V2I01_23375 [Micromonospora sp. BRA006-A]|nr:hypothetical protein [Micromonospora sp. BRA006-A]